MTKQALITILDEKQDELFELIENLPEDILIEPGVYLDWSIKDILAHLAHWEAQLVTLLWQARQGSKPTTIHFSGSDINKIATKWVLESRDRSYELILDDLSGVREQTIRRVGAFSDQELSDPTRFPWLKNKPLHQWVAESSYQLTDEYLNHIRKWLDSRR